MAKTSWKHGPAVLSAIKYYDRYCCPDEGVLDSSCLNLLAEVTGWQRNRVRSYRARLRSYIEYIIRLSLVLHCAHRLGCSHEI